MTSQDKQLLGAIREENTRDPDACARVIRIRARRAQAIARERQARTGQSCTCCGELPGDCLCTVGCRPQAVSP